MEGNRIFISFFLYKSRKTTKGTIPIFARITHEGNRLNHNTGLFTDEKSWDTNKYLVKGNKPEALEINKCLSSLKAKIISIHNELLEKEIPISIEVLKLKLAGRDTERKTLLEAIKYHNALIAKSSETRKATSTKYQTLENKVIKYLAHQYQRKDIFLKELNYQFAVDFEMYLKIVDNISHNPAIKYIQLLKKIVNMSIAHGWLDRNPLQNFKCVIKEVERGFLTMDEVDKLHGKEISNTRLATVRDIFIFCCYTGLSYADVKKLTQQHIVIGEDGNNWINSIRTKTGTRISVPILPVAESILNQYKGLHKNKTVLPVLSNQKMNAYLKELGDICRIEKKLTFHLARHTFATTITLTNGVPLESVSKMLGHTNLKTTQIYAKVVDTKISQDMQQLKIKLTSNPKN